MPESYQNRLIPVAPIQHYHHDHKTLQKGALFAYLVALTSITTRRSGCRHAISARPLLPRHVSGWVTGCVLPLPSAWIRLAGTPISTRYFLTASARRTDSC